MIQRLQNNKLCNQWASLGNKKETITMLSEVLINLDFMHVRMYCPQEYKLETTKTRQTIINTIFLNKNVLFQT